ncbi:MAG: FprA family A-type flavoprotein [Paludibacteraceae bacterium]
MFLNRKVAKDTFYVGVNDRIKAKFENIIPIPKGVSYNSYLIVDEKIALIDTVDICYGDLFVQKIKSQLNEKNIDYLIINHMEPDHSSSISLIRKYYPSITLVGNAKTLGMIEGYYGIDDNMLEIKDGEILPLGLHQLQFHLTPMVHWPETMMTYDITTKTLFSGDAFGCFGALDGGVIDEEISVERYWDEMALYYANIIGKYGSPVQKALQKLTPLEIEIICPTHGPIWKEYIDKTVDIYDRMSRYEAKEGAVIAYGSMYGNTEQIAEAVAKGLVMGGIKNVVMHHVATVDSSVILKDIFKYKGLVIGSPTYCNDLHPEIDALIRKIENRGIKNRDFAYFGSFSWAGVAAKKLTTFAENMKWRTPDFSIEEKMGLKENNYQSSILLGKKLAELIRTEVEEDENCR